MDASSFSRLRKGQRIPRKASRTIRKISDWIYLYMDDNNRLNDLCLLIGASGEDSADAIKTALIDWLYEGQNLPAPQRKTRSPKKKQPDCKTFGMRLESAMQLAELSNIQFSRLVNVDTSLVSRFRSGVRTPNSNPVIARRITSVLWERLKSLNKTKELAGVRYDDGRLDTRTPAADPEYEGTWEIHSYDGRREIDLSNPNGYRIHLYDMVSVNGRQIMDGYVKDDHDEDWICGLFLLQ